MTAKDRNVLLVVLAVALIGASWMLLISPQRKAAADAQAQVDAAQQQLVDAQAKLDAGKAAQDAFRRDRVAIVKLGRVVPESDDIPTLLTQLNTLAKRHKIRFDKYELSQTTGGAAPATADPAAATTPAGSASAVGGPGSSEADGPSSTDAIAPLYPPGSTEIAGGLGRTSIALKLRGSYFNLERYLRSVQHFARVSAQRTQADGRLMIVDSFNYKVDEETGDALIAELTASVYFAPPVEVPSAGAPGAAAPAATPASSSTAPAPTGTGTAAIGGVK